MKKQIFIYLTLLFAAALTAYGFIKETKACEVVMVHQASSDGDLTFAVPDFNVPETEFFYDFGTRFKPIKRSSLQKTISLTDLLDMPDDRAFNQFYKVSVIEVKRNYDTEQRTDAKGSELNEEQLKMLSSLDYSTSFLLKAYYSTINNASGEEKQDYFSPHFTVVPEKEVAYIDGKAAFLDYFRSNNNRLTKGLDQDQLRPGKLFFTVNKNGGIDKIILERSCGFTEIDDRMLKLAKDLPGKWNPAENSNGDKIDQELVISYGLIGC